MFLHKAMWIWPDAINQEPPHDMIARLHAARIDTVIPYISFHGLPGERGAYDTRIHAIIDEAHRHGMTVLACFDEMVQHEGMPTRDGTQIRADGQPDRRGLLCPAHPTSRDYILQQFEQILTTFELDGVNLEDSYVYNPTTIYDLAHSGGASYSVIPVCYCAHCRRHAPIEQPKWHQWRMDQLTSLVQAQSRMIRERLPKASFSVAARMPYARDDFYAPYHAKIPYYDGWQHCQSRDALAADWVAWLRHGIIDFACPMSYYHSSRLVELQTLECHHRIPDARQSVWMGLGLDCITAEYMQGLRDGAVADERYCDAYRNDATVIRHQLELLQRLGQQHVVFFSHAFLNEEHIRVMSEY